jgi:hypothetical protein
MSRSIFGGHEFDIVETHLACKAEVWLSGSWVPDERNAQWLNPWCANVLIPKADIVCINDSGTHGSVGVVLEIDCMLKYAVKVGYRNSNRLCPTSRL